jgi:NAD(P)-dependent dehydrogenase (short-subunit alcohol dehydrogenase family)
MEIKDKVVVITGGGSGIGAGLARRFVAEGAEAVVVADRNADTAAALAGEIGALAETVDVAAAAEITALVERTIERFGRVDLFCSNAGIGTGVGLDDPDDMWHKAFDVNVMAHVYAARAVLPGMLARGSGYLLNTSPGDGPYTVTKHGAVAFAEWLAVMYGDRGIGVSVLCPLGVATPLLMEPLAAGHPSAQAVADSGRILEVEDVADSVVAGLTNETFLILPHPEVGRFWAQKAADPQRWLAGLRRLIARQNA